VLLPSSTQNYKTHLQEPERKLGVLRLSKGVDLVHLPDSVDRDPLVGLQLLEEDHGLLGAEKVEVGRLELGEFRGVGAGLVPSRGEVVSLSTKQEGQNTKTVSSDAPSRKRDAERGEERG
jgi:hypothetical protein